MWLLLATLTLPQARGSLVPSYEHLDDDTDAVYRTRFNSWKERHGKTYCCKEEELRYNIFMDNVRRIASHNKKQSDCATCVRLDINQFADLTSNEFRRYLGYKSNMTRIPGIPRVLQPHTKSLRVDWSVSDSCGGGPCVSEVKNQGPCGSCWAFSSTGAIESRFAIKKNKPVVPLSEQHLVDCAAMLGGCDGGNTEAAFLYATAVGGLCTEEEYPYQAKKEVCRSSPLCDSDPIHGWVDVIPKNETQLEAAVDQGPVSVAIEADSDDMWRFYTGGVMTGNCGSKTNHAVLVVGYGVETNVDGKEVKYWKVKNSWGTKWGHNGYFKLAKGLDVNHGAGQCGILSSPTYPVIDDDSWHFGR